MHLVPILRRNNGHVVDRKVFNDVIKGGRASAAAGAYNGSCRLVGKLAAAAEEQTVQK